MNRNRTKRFDTCPPDQSVRAGRSHFLYDIAYYMRIILSGKETRPTQGGYYSFVAGLLTLVLLFLFTSRALLAEEQGKVLILNSDMSIYKYSVAHTEFKSKVDIVEAQIDLGSKWTNEKMIRKEILKVDPDVIYCIGSKALLFAGKIAEDKQIVFSLAINWRRFSIGKNIYGIANELPQGMQLTTYRYFFPDIKKIGVLYSRVYNKEWLDIAVEKAKDLGIEIVGKSVARTKDVKKILNKLLPDVDALMLIPDPIIVNDIESVSIIFEQSEAVLKPIFAYSKAFAGFGPTLVVGPDIITISRQAGNLVNNLLKKHEIKEKVQSPAGSHIILNMKKVEEYGLNLNIDALDSVNEIIR